MGQERTGRKWWPQLNKQERKWRRIYMGISTITLQYSNERGNKKNTSYPFRFEIQSVEELKKVAQFDHVCGEYADGKKHPWKYHQGLAQQEEFPKSQLPSGGLR